MLEFISKLGFLNHAFPWIKVMKKNNGAVSAFTAVVGSSFCQDGHGTYHVQGRGKG